MPRPKGSKNKVKKDKGVWSDEAKARASVSAKARRLREHPDDAEKLTAKWEEDKARQAREIKEEFAKLVGELVRRREEEGIRYYKPNRAQALFHYAINKDGGICRTRVLQGSNKVGKTCGGIVEDIAHALGYRPWLQEDDPNYKINVSVPNNGLILGETIVTSVDKKLSPELLRWLPKRCMYETRKNPQGVIVKVKIPYGIKGEKCGSTIHLGSYDQPPDTQEGIDWGWVHYDEPPPHENYIAVERGKIAGDARSWLTMTPLKEPWILDQIIERAEFDSDVSVTIGEIWDNAESNGGVLKQEAIDEFIKKLDPDEYEARILGKWKHLAGLVYSKWWKDDLHIIDDFDMSKCFRSGWTPYEAVDPHDNRATCWLFAAMGPNSRLYVYDYLLVTGTVAEIAQKVRVKRGVHGYVDPQFVVLDKKHGQKHNAALAEGLSWELSLQKSGIRKIILSDSSAGDVDFGHKKVKEYLEASFSTLHNKELPRLMFFKNGCSGQGGPIYQMKRYSYEDMGDAHEKNPRAKPKDLNKDFPDCVRYLCMKDPKYIDPERVKANKEALKRRYDEFVGVRRGIYGGNNEVRAHI